ncbi:hypothetical protein [Streptomyces sp. NPDC060187]|uniref:hypothetical protein n=1 Tax=Streptomyces sp. NPDC060187 TaxID=3347067 RepID=UPI003655F2BA
MHDGEMGVSRDSAKDYLYYASNWAWPVEREGSIKSLLLFFDGIAYSIPAESLDRSIERSPAVAQPLLEKGMLINLAPTEILAPDTSAQLAAVLSQWINDHPEWRHNTGHFVPLTRTSQHWGDRRDRQIREAEAFTQTLRTLGLAQATAEAELWQLPPQVFFLVLAAYSAALQYAVQQRSDITLQPVFELLGPYRRAGRHFGNVMGSPFMQSRGVSRIVQSDFTEVGVDLTDVPLDEIIDFRNKHKESFRAYVDGLRNLLTTMRDLNEDQVSAEIRERSKQLAEEAGQLRRTTRRAFGRNLAGTMLAIGGVMWTGIQGDPIGALLGVGSAGISFTRPTMPVTSYSYIFEISRTFG